MRRSSVCRGIYRHLRGIRDFIHPRALVWRYHIKRFPQKAIITKLSRRDLKIRIYPRDVIGKDIYIHGVFEKDECHFALNFLSPGMVFFDVGANLGQYTLLAADRVGETGQVHSFEPSPRMFKELLFNVELNKLSGICHLNNQAISNHEGTAQLSIYEPGGEVYGSIGTQHWCNSKIIKYESVATTTLDHYVEKNELQHVDLIKIDIEGAELLALQGAAELLSRDDSPQILIEVADINTAGFGYPAMEIIHYLESLGYRLFSFGPKGKLEKIVEFPRPKNLALNVVGIK
jgi:FkbM family methyltransferase